MNSITAQNEAKDSMINQEGNSRRCAAVKNKIKTDIMRQSRILPVLLFAICITSFLISAVFAYRVIKLENHGYNAKTQFSEAEVQLQDQQTRIDKLLSTVNALSQRITALEDINMVRSRLTDSFMLCYGVFM